ncbi:MAG: hypothetical protein P9F75_07090 [Candidatus Contendobacter sp.]|nr:hypothetical protein [Candidatus Contendobacter sp.]
MFRNSNPVRHFSSLIILFLAGCATPVTEKILMPPKDVPELIKSVQINTFSANSGDYGRRVTEAIRSLLVKEGYIQVVNQGGQAVLKGDVNIGRINRVTDSNSYQVKVKDRGGSKRTETRYIYTITTGVASNITYTVSKGGKAIGGNSYNITYNKQVTGSSSDEARSNAESDDSIILGQIQELAQKVVAGISPHSENWEFKPQGGSGDLDAGVEYYRKGLYPQAESYWSRVAQQAVRPEEKAAAHYNLGMLNMRNGQYPQAFANFREADKLQPANAVYMDALRKVEDAGLGQKKLEEMNPNRKRGGSGSRNRSKRSNKPGG